MKSVKKVLAYIAVILIIISLVMLTFREQVKAVAVKKYAEHWTENLLEGAGISDDDIENMSGKVGEFYSLAVKKVIPEGSLEQLWSEIVRNTGVAYLYLKNYFRTAVFDSGLDTMAKEKAKAVVDKFLGYIKDGRVTASDIKNLNDKTNLFNPGESTLKGISDEDIEKTVRHLDAANQELERRGPGRPVDPVGKFKEVVDRMDGTLKKYGEKEEEKN